MSFTDTLTHLLPLAGTVLGGPLGGAVGTAAAGLMGQSNANELQKKFEDTKVNPYDPMQMSYLGKLQRQERQYRAGTDTSSAFAMRNAMNNGAQTQGNLTRAGGPGLVGNLLRSQAVTGNTVAGVGARASGFANQMLGMQGGIIGDMADKAYEQQKYNRGLAFANYQNARQDANNNMLAAAGLASDALGDKGLLGGLKFGAGSQGGGGGFGNAWRTQGTGNTMPSSPTSASQYTMLPGSVQAPTSAYDMGQQVII